MKTVTLNGEPRRVDADTVAALVSELGLAGPMVLVEQNGVALQMSEWLHARIHDGDRVEILRIAAGG
jgi:thiamine biosynthesis protein ThiS